MKIRLDLIKPSPRPIRTSWDEDKMKELTQSIEEQGLIVPIKVRPSEDGTYEIVYGHRRTEACRRAGYEEIEAIVEGLDDHRALLQQIMENDSKEDVPYEDRARGYQRALDETGWGVRELARQTGIPRTTITHSLQWLAEKEQGAAVVIDDHTAARSDGQGVWQTLEISRQLGDDVEAKRAVAEKVGREGLTRLQTRNVAESIAVTKDPRRRKKLLETPYDPLIHDPEWNLERAKKYGEYDPESVKREPTQGQQWEASPEVKVIIDTLRAWEKKVPEMSKAVQLGKFSPEARPFVLRRVERLIAELRNLATELEE